MKHIRIGFLLVVVLGLLVPTPLHAQGPVNYEDYLLFSDDFEGGPDPAWQISGGWAPEEHSGNTIFVARQAGTAWVQSGGTWPGDYVFRANTRLDYGGVGLSFRLTQEARYVVQYNADGLYLLKDYPRGTFTVLAQAAAPSLTVWHPITIGCEGPHIQVYVDQALAIDYTDPSPILEGTVGVGALDDTLAGIAYALVLRLPHSLPAGGVVGQPPAVQFSGPPDQPPPVQPGGPDNPPPAGWPDMVITDVALSSTTPQVGEAINVWPTIANQGTAAAEGFDVVLIPTYEPGGPNNPGGMLPIQTLQPGEQVTTELQALYAQPGQYTLRVLVTNDWYLTGNVEPGGTLQWDVIVTVVGAGEEPPPPPAGQPDLTVVNATSTAMASPPGTAVTNYTVQNVGTADAGAFTVRWYPHGRSDEVGCSEDVSFLGAGQSVDLSCIYTYVDQHGEMHWRVIVDADSDIAESNENNNQANGTVTIEGGQEPPPSGQADLVLTGANATAMDSPPGTVVSNYTVQNIGTADAGAFTVRWYPHGLSDEVGCSEDVGFLGAGQSVDLSCTYTYVDQHGEMHWRVVVDAENDVGESDESNNQRNGTVQIEGGQEPPPPPVGQADLVATDVAVRPLAGPVGMVDIVITVQNVGTADAGLFTVEWRPHGNSDEVGCSQDLALAAGESQWVRCQYTYVGHGEMHWRVLLDVDNDIAESDEGNNETSGTVTIEAH